MSTGLLSKDASSLARAAVIECARNPREVLKLTQEIRPETLFQDEAIRRNPEALAILQEYQHATIECIQKILECITVAATNEAKPFGADDKVCRKPQ